MESLPCAREIILLAGLAADASYNNRVRKIWYAIILFLNQDDPQPRERDYSYVGSFFAFSIWIGAGVAAIGEFIENKIS